MLGIHAVFVDNSQVKFRFSFYIYQDPLQGNGHWFPYVYIKTIYEAMVIDFLSLHRGPLRSNGHRFLYIKALCEAMVINLFTSRPSAKQWPLISYVTSRPSARQWSSISLQQGPLRGNSHWFLMPHRGPLQGNGHWSLYIETLCKAMVIDFCVTSGPSTRLWSLNLLDIDPLHGNGH